MLMQTGTDANANCVEIWVSMMQTYLLHLVLWVTVGYMTYVHLF